MPSTEETQLGVIAEAVGALSEGDIPCWLAGGWAVDFLLGEITRTHRDIDIVIWSGHAQRAATALCGAGFEQRPTPRPDELSRFERKAVPVTLSFIERDRAGAIVSLGRFRDWPWPADSLTASPGRIGGIEVPIVSLAAQIDGKENYPAHPCGAPLRLEDEADLARLRPLRCELQGQAPL